MHTISEAEPNKANFGSHHTWMSIPQNLCFRQDSHGVILYCYPNQTALFSKQPITLLGKRFQDFLPTRIFQTLEACRNQCLRNNTLTLATFDWQLERTKNTYEARFIPLEAGQCLTLIQNITAQEALESRLRQSERELADFFENASIGLHWVGPDGVIKRANAAELKMLGYTADEYIGHPVTEFHVDQDVAQDILARLNRNEVLSNYEARLRCKDGSIRTVLIDSSVFWENGEFIHTRCFTRDITAFKAAQEAIRKSEERYQLILEGTNDGVWDWDPMTDKVYWSDRFYEIIGLSRQTHPANAELGWELMHPEDRPRVKAAVETYLRKKTKYEMQFRVKHVASGQYRHVLSRAKAIWDESGKPIRMAGVYTDITDKVAAEQVILESEERFRIMADSAPVLIWVADVDGGGTYFNKRWLEYTGCTLEEELGTGWIQRIHPEDIEECVTTCMEGKKQLQPFSMAFRLRRYDGEYRWFYDTASPRFTPNGDFSGYIGSCVDITELKEAKEAAEAANQKKSQFLANMSHELRTPLNSIIGYSEMLEHGMGGELTEKQRKYIHNVVTSGRHLLDMVNEILDLSKIEAGKIVLHPEPIRWATFLQEKQDTFEQFLKSKQVTLHFHRQPGLEFVYADYHRLRQVFLNLLNNAIKFNLPGGAIHVRIAQSKDGQWIQCDVEDTGIGIPKDKLPELFTEFYQVDNSFSREHEGTGLGLAVTKRLVELHGGTISVTSQEGVGSTFTFTLPAYCPAADPVCV